jgi:hypothetical protein
VLCFADLHSAEVFGSMVMSKAAHVRLLVET